jgi:hypothetical protein
MRIRTVRGRMRVINTNISLREGKSRGFPAPGMKYLDEHVAPRIGLAGKPDVRP